MKRIKDLHFNEFYKQQISFDESYNNLREKFARSSILLREYRHRETGKLLFMLPKEAQHCPGWQRV